jgi:biopolymer transport protein ExbD
MNFQFRCPACNKKLSATERLIGRRKTCPRCNTKFMVPAPDAESPPSSPEDADQGGSSEHALLLFPSKHGKHEDLIDMTAMVDIVFFLLIFFLVTSLQSLESVINLPAPQASSPTGVRTASDFADDPAYVTVTIEEGDRLWVEEEEAIGEQDLRAKLRAAKQKIADCRGMLVTGSPEASHGTFVMVVDAGADAGLQELLFSVPEDAADGG